MKLSQVIVFAKDVRRMRDFYTRALELTVIEETEAADLVRLDAGGPVIFLHAIPEAVARGIVIDDPPRARADNPIKLTFHTSDVGAARARLIEAGAQMSEPRCFDAIEICDGVDPEGNVFQISNR